MKRKRYSLPKQSILALLLLMLFAGCLKDPAEIERGNEGDQQQLQLSDFSSALACKDCHPVYYEEWSGSMHAYAFVDPINTFWMNSLREALGADELGQACVQCHSPIGTLTGETPNGFDKADVDPLVREGITCDACHLMVKPSPTTIGEAIYHYDVESGRRYASITDPVPNDFHGSAALPFYAESRSCLPCHDLINDQGVPVEVTYSEWLASPMTAMGMECQDCHMETYSGQAAVNGPQRDNLHRHDFIGVDVALLTDFPNKATQRTKIEELLRNSVTFTVNASDAVSANGNLQVEALVKNDKTGHDIPSSVTFVRQMWLEVTVRNGTQVIYQSGYFDANGDLKDENSELEPNGDPDLVLFQSRLFRDGQPANVVTADSIEIRTIAAFQTRGGTYTIPVAASPGEQLDLHIRLRFRTFPPYAIRGVGEDILARVPIFEMDEFEKTIVVN